MNIKIGQTSKSLSAFGGIYLFSELINHLNLKEKLSLRLPQPKIDTPASPFEKFQAMCLGLVAGGDSLDDMKKLAVDDSFKAVNADKVNAPSTYGDFLRSFTHQQCKSITDDLIATSLEARKALFPDYHDFILDLDSTPHEQCGQKMEGLAWNYKNMWCLDSLQAYDSLGFCYWYELREGNTFTSNGSPTAIHYIFKQVPERWSRYFRADSGYCNSATMNAAANANAKFVITMRENMYGSLIKYVRNWRKAPKDIIFKSDKTRAVEIGTAPYFLKGFRNGKMLRVVFLRSPKVGEQGNSLFSDDLYEYVAWVTNMGEHDMSNARIVRFARGRANCENYIKEGKNGLDLQHFPCQKLVANKAYALIAAFAYNLMRAAGFLINPKKPAFSKQIRFRMVNLACQVVRHAGSITLRFPINYYKEVNTWLTTIKLKFAYG